MDFYFLSEAVERRDSHFRKMALDAYNRVVERIHGKDYQSLSDSSFGKFKIVYDIQPKTVAKRCHLIISAEHPDSFGFVKKASIPNVHRGDGIIFSNMDGPDVFIHEYIHFLDTVRTGHAAEQTLTDRMRYYNSPEELNAYYQEAAHKIQERVTDLTSRVDPQMAKRLFDTFFGGGNINTFADKFMSNPLYFDQEFIKSLSPRNIKRIKKRLYGLYLALKNKLVVEKFS